MLRTYGQEQGPPYQIRPTIRINSILGKASSKGAHTTITSILWRLLDILDVVVQVNGNMNEITKLLVRAKE